MLPTTHFAPKPGRLARGSRFGSTPVISVTALAGVPAFVREAFGGRLLSRANQAAMLDIETIEDQDCFIPHITMTTFADAVAKLSGEEHFGLIVAPHLTIASYGCWGDYVLGAATLGAAIERAMNTLGFHSRGDAMSVRVVENEARLSYASAAKGQQGYQHVACGAAGVVISLCRTFLSPAWRPRRVELDIPRPPCATPFEDGFECPVVFGAPIVTVCFDARCLSNRPAGWNATSLVTIHDLARARVQCHKLNGLRDILAEQIWSQVLTGKVSIGSAARSLNTSVRTLQRELNREGTDFRTLANVMRTRRAIELLRHSDASVTNISMALGYSSPAHFTRAFHKATGLSPREFRQRNSPTLDMRTSASGAEET
ncbi:MAG TPA: AraC family transcriptional regulator ligand-binding domain-containing protein [Methyloceanibacter sp.]|nr:AraC family transcriptional regulator ligand-binding domain-containing protein [Methyloceanibacter sp.]